MIQLNAEEMEKVRLMDRAFSSMSFQEVQVMFGESSVIDKLKGNNEPVGLFCKLLDETNLLHVQLSFVQAELFSLKDDMKKLVKVADDHSRPMVPQYSSELHTLKLKHSVY